MSNFINNLIVGDALLREVDDYIHSWHESESKVSLHEYLGMTCLLRIMIIYHLL